MEGDFSVNNDLRATELRATSAYSLVEDGDDQLALATAAAAAHIAMEHENRRRSRGGQVRLRALAAGLPQQRQRVGEVIQGIRERTPEVIQGIRERTPEMIGEVRARMPEVLQEIREKTPEVLHGIREFVREHVLPPDSSPLEYEDSTGRKVSNTAYYNNSLNEDREQPPLSSRRIGAHCNQAWKNLYQVPKSEGAEYYVNFDDGNAQDAIKGVTAPGSANLQNKAKLVNTGYANMSDPLDVKRHSPTKRQETVQQQSRIHNAGGELEDGASHFPAQSRYEWGSHSKMPEEEKKECEEQVNSKTMEPMSASTLLHSTAKYQWGETASSAARERVAAQKNDTMASLEDGAPSDDVPGITTSECKGAEEATAGAMSEPLVNNSSPKDNDNEELETVMPHILPSKKEEYEEATENVLDKPLLDLSSPNSKDSERTPKEEPHNPSSVNEDTEEATADISDKPLLDLSSPQKTNTLSKEEPLENESDNALPSDVAEQSMDSVDLVTFVEAEASTEALAEAQETPGPTTEARIETDITGGIQSAEGAMA